MSKMCEPIAALVQSLHHLGFTTIEQKVSDYHFSELYIKMKGKHNNEIDTIN
ncbi:MAG: AraC family transcriptional regulator, partial [Prevotella pallens]|nr:AraC family transcriptional regulator [Prevotella pallens]